MVALMVAYLAETTDLMEMPRAEMKGWMDLQRVDKMVVMKVALMAVAMVELMVAYLEFGMAF